MKGKLGYVELVAGPMPGRREKVMENMENYFEELERERREDLQDLKKINGMNEANVHDYDGFVVPAGELLSCIVENQKGLVERLADADDRDDLIFHAQWVTYQMIYNTVVNELAEEKKGDK